MYVLLCVCACTCYTCYLPCHCDAFTWQVCMLLRKWPGNLWSNLFDFEFEYIFIIKIEHLCSIVQPCSCANYGTWHMWPSMGKPGIWDFLWKSSLMYQLYTRANSPASLRSHASLAHFVHNVATRMEIREITVWSHCYARLHVNRK